MELKDIVPNYVSEGEQVERKARLDRTNILGWLKSIDGFANAKGGVLYIGVEDKTGKLIGFDSPKFDEEKLFFYHVLNEHMPILPSISTEAISYDNRGKTLYIMKAKIDEGEKKPFLVKYQGMSTAFIRRDGYTSPATAEELWNMAKSFASPSFDRQFVDIAFRLEDFRELNAFYKERVGKDLTEKELSSLGFFSKEKKLAKGALLFKDDYRNEKELKIVCSSYRGYSKGDDVVLSSESFSGNLIASYRFIWEYLQLRISHGFIKKGTSREDMEAYPTRALFEAIINALAHRDYLIDGSQISVDLFKNRLVITSPGAILNGGEIATTHKLSSFFFRAEKRVDQRRLRPLQGDGSQRNGI